MPIHDQNGTRDSKTKMFAYPHLPLLKTYIHGMVEAKEEPGIWNCTVTNSLERKLGYLKANLVRKCKKNQHLQEQGAAHT